MKKRGPVSDFVSILNCIYCIQMILEGRATKIEVKGSGECILEQEEGVMMRPHEAGVVDTFFHRWQQASDTIHEETVLDQSSFDEPKQYHEARARMAYCFLQASSLFRDRKDRDVGFFGRVFDEDIIKIVWLTDAQAEPKKSCAEIATGLGY